jgi:diketogulonate reductase-like aldo/keto reductase
MLGATLGLAPVRLWASELSGGGLRTRAIPRSGEQIPVIGMGTWLTFHVPLAGRQWEDRAAVLAEFFRQGGGMVDSSPMYGNAEAVLGRCLEQTGAPASLFSASKVWTANDAAGPEQMGDAERLWGLSGLDLQQVHNLVNWRAHLPMLRAAKEAGRIRYVGVTTSHGRRHDELERILRTEALDFVQLTYNLRRTEAEPLLDLAAERGVAVIVNRPMGGGRLIDFLQRHPLPAWAAEWGIEDWPDYVLRWIVSHPAVTCAIPATTRTAHLRENMRAGRGRVLGAAERRRMKAHVDGLLARAN